jgi:hypothetical protein
MDGVLCPVIRMATTSKIPARQVASRAAAQVVNEKPFESGFSTCGVPRLANVADLLSTLVKDKRTVDAPALGSLLNDFPKPAGKRQYPRLGIFRVFDLGAWHELDRKNVFGGL